MIVRVPGFAGLAERLRLQATALARARLAAARAEPAERWRRPPLLWPLFTRG
jgi:hypothetical protein